MGEKFNPFLAETEDLEIKNEEELREAKEKAGVVSEEEHKERMKNFFIEKGHSSISAERIIKAWKGVEHELDEGNIFEIAELILKNK